MNISYYKQKMCWHDLNCIWVGIVGLASISSSIYLFFRNWSITWMNKFVIWFCELLDETELLSVHWEPLCFMMCVSPQVSCFAFSDLLAAGMPFRHTSWCISLRRKYFPIPIVRLFFPAVAASRCYSTDYWVTTVTSVSSRISQSGKDRQPNRSPTTVLGSQLFESRVIPELLRLAGAIDAVRHGMNQCTGSINAPKLCFDLDTADCILRTVCNCWSQGLHWSNSSRFLASNDCQVLWCRISKLRLSALQFDCLLEAGRNPHGSFHFSYALIGETSKPVESVHQCWAAVQEMRQELMLCVPFQSAVELCLAQNLKQVCTVNTPLNSRTQWSIQLQDDMVIALWICNKCVWGSFWIPEVCKSAGHRKVLSTVWGRRDAHATCLVATNTAYSLAAPLGRDFSPLAWNIFVKFCKNDWQSLYL